MTDEMMEEAFTSDIAIVGMAGRFPGADNVQAFWENIRNGIESITFLEDDEIDITGLESLLTDVIKHPQYIKARGILENADQFDAGFFGLNPREAEIMDPQHRLFLESAWHALENAGYTPANFQGRIGVYGGAGLNLYSLINLRPNLDLIKDVGFYQTFLGNDKDFLCTRVSYKLDLRGPSVSVNTACSTSLVAVHMACQSLLNGECDMALAGGVSLSLPQNIGYLYQEGGILSPDGHCRPFDSRAKGTVGGGGVALVTLKRLDDALADGDTIHAVIKGSAINNDGTMKIGYTAPSIEGQSVVLAEALALSQVEPDTIQYIEAHGTATPLGDPVEIAALTQAYQTDPERTGYCAIGSVKGNVGHLDAAAGVTGLIKTVMALKHQQLPPSLHFEKPNPRLELEQTPFYVNTTTKPWPSQPHAPRRAAVSSFGIGGTNAHLILEEAPPPNPTSKSRAYHLLTVSAKNEMALQTAVNNLTTHLHTHNDSLADVAYTLNTGRQAFDHRAMVVTDSTSEAIHILKDPTQLLTQQSIPTTHPITFLYTGQGSQYPNMGRDLYEQEPIFREAVDQCANILQPHLKLDIRTVLYPTHGEDTSEQLTQTAVAQPALFTIEYALTQLWQAWGIIPTSLMGHSIGEYVAACVSGVFSLEDALALVVLRGRLMQALPSGAMLSVQLSAEAVRPYLQDGVQLAAVNSDTLTVLSGTHEAIQATYETLTNKQIQARLLHTSHAFHSAMMEPILSHFEKAVASKPRHAPQIPFISNVTGTWITEAEATSANYWARHIRSAVLFANGLSQLLTNPDAIFIEVGPSNTLTTFARQHSQRLPQHLFVQSLHHPKTAVNDTQHLLTTVGRLWLAGVSPDWSAFYQDEQRQRLPLPVYPFQWQRYWVDRQPESQMRGRQTAVRQSKETNIAHWFYQPSWQRQRLTNKQAKTEQTHWLLLTGNHAINKELILALESNGDKVTTVPVGTHTAQIWQTLKEETRLPQKLVHLASLDRATDSQSAREQGLYSFVDLVQQMTQQGIVAPMELIVITEQAHEVTGSETIAPDNAMLLGACKVIPQEYPHLACRLIDVDTPHLTTLLTELTADVAERVVAYRGRHRWAQTFLPQPLPALTKESSPLRENGVYLITGGFGNIGRLIARYLAETVQARLVLTSRTAVTAGATDARGQERYQFVQELEALGASVLVVQGDVADVAEITAVRAQISDQFGTLHGLIHTAGLIKDENFNTVQTTDRALFASQFRSKVDGVTVLQTVFAKDPLDFYIVTSSLAAILGGLGDLAYATANIYMDAFAIKHRWVTLNWDAWQFENVSVEGGPANLMTLAMQPEEGLETFKRALAHLDQPQWVISTNSLSARLAQWIERKPPTTGADGKRPSESTNYYPRPQMSMPYVEPSTPLAKRVADIWEELLGIQPIGENDDFFELGGDSLSATMLLSRLRQTFETDFPLAELFAEPTVAGVTRQMQATHQAQTDKLSTISELLQQVQTLYPDEEQS